MDEITMSSTNHITVQLPQFEGPLALLLYLIRKEEMDIMNIQIHKITQQYLDYIKLMKELDLEVAGEFIAMAATLIQIKSRMLLPQYDENGEIVENDDPRKELVQRLLEYQKYQEAAKALYERPLLGRDVWARGMTEKLEAKEEDIVLDENPVFSLITAYRRAIRTAKKKIHQVTAKLQSIATRILEIKDQLVVGKKIPLSELITATDGRRKQMLITFLSILELGKIGFVSLFQTDVYQEIYVEAKQSVQSDVLSKVEEYDNLHSEELAAQLINESEPIENNIENLHVEMASDEEIALAENEIVGVEV
jgi:segregation and condensation protein A